MSRRRKNKSVSPVATAGESSRPATAPSPASLGYATPRRRAKPSSPEPIASAASIARLLTQVAFILSLALVVARLLMPESIRSPEDPLAAGRPAGQIVAGNTDILLSPSAQSPGPAAGVVLDLLFCLPAILILIRRAIDREYRLLISAAMIPMTLLALLALCSPLWAADRFASIVSAMHFSCAMVFLWSTFQLIRSWIRLRIVAGVCIGAVMALSLVGYTYRLSELRDLRQMFDDKKAQILAQHEWTPGSYQAEMFEKRILNGQPMGFRTSTNTYAALLVLLGIISAGVVIQHVSDKDHWGWTVVPALAAAAILPVVHWTLCRAAYVTPIMAAMILCATWLMRRWFAFRANFPAPSSLYADESAGVRGDFQISSQGVASGLTEPMTDVSTDAATTPAKEPGNLSAARASRPRFDSKNHGQDARATDKFPGTKTDPSKPTDSLTRKREIRFWHTAYFSVIVCIAGLAAFIIHHGLRFGTLWHDSLSFRWRYWTGTYGIMTSGLHASPRLWSNFLLGVGWENFGPAYLMHRLPIAPEEIRDPHNFIIRAFVELGIVGGILMLAWMLRLWWELTRPVLPGFQNPGLETPVLGYSEEPGASRETPGSLRTAARNQQEGSASSYRTQTVMQTIIGIALLAMLVNTLAAIDFGSQGAYIVVELFRRCIFFLMIFAGLLTACVRRSPLSAHDQPGDIQLELDDRPAPWILYAVLAALGTFLIHNLIEFALFEPGPLFLFALLTGGALGIRAAGRAEENPPMNAAPSSARWKFPAIGAGIAGLAWLVAGGALAFPIIQAESLAHDADDDTLAALKSHDQRLMVKAASEMAGAFQEVPYNADYARRCAELLIASESDRADFSKTRKMLDAAIAADPSSVQDLTMRGELLLQADDDHPDAGQIEAGIRDYYRALYDLDPNNVRMRIEFAHQLLHAAKVLHRPKLAADAALEFDRALDYDAQLPAEEIKRLTPTELIRLHAEKAEAESISGHEGISHLGSGSRPSS